MEENLNPKDRSGSGMSELIVRTTPLVGPESKRLHAMDKNVLFSAN